MIGRPHSRRAVTLIEAVLFISVALGLIVGGIVFYQQASLGARVARQASILSALSAEARVVFKASDPGALDGLTSLSDVLIAAGGTPSDIVDAAPGANGSRLRSAWGTELDIQVFEFTRPDGVADLLILFFLFDIPQSACARLLPVDSSLTGVFAPGVTLVGTGEDGGVVGWTSGRDTPVSPSEAAQACAGADQDGDGRVLAMIALWGFL